MGSKTNSSKTVEWFGFIAGALIVVAVAAWVF